MTEDEKKEFEEFLEWKAEKIRKEEENKAKQEEAERQVKVNAQMPQVEEEKSMEFDNKQVPYSSNNKIESNNTGEKPTTFPLQFVIFIFFYFSSCVLLYYKFQLMEIKRLLIKLSQLLIARLIKKDWIVLRELRE